MRLCKFLRKQFDDIIFIFPQIHQLFVLILGQAWAAATTEGLLIYSLEMGLVFDPFHLELGITPDSVRNTLERKEFAKGNARKWHKKNQERGDNFHSDF